jgi:hypothetical protein
MAVQPKLPSKQGGSDSGQVKGNAQADKFGVPFEAVDKGVFGLDGLHNDIGEKSGFEGNTSAYITKKGTPYGEAAKLNFMPPGMDIGDQDITDQRNMPLKKLVAESYPGDGWEPAPRDIPEATR